MNNVRKKRPVAVLVLAILHLIFGFFFIVGGCFGKGIVFLYPHLPAEFIQDDPVMLAQLHLIRNDPTYLPLTGTFLVLYIAAGLGQILAGIGLLNMKSWARTLALALAGLILLLLLGHTLHELIVVVPQERHLAEDAPPIPFFDQRWLVDFTMFSRLFGLVPDVLLALATVVILLSRHVRAAFESAEEAQLPPAEEEAPWTPPRGDDDRIQRLD